LGVPDRQQNSCTRSLDTLKVSLPKNLHFVQLALVVAVLPKLPPVRLRIQAIRRGTNDHTSDALGYYIAREFAMRSTVGYRAERLL